MVSIEIDDEKISRAKSWILESVRNVDPSEVDSTNKDLDKIIRLWSEGNLNSWGAMGGTITGDRLMDPHGDLIPDVVFKVPTSLRSSDLNTSIKLYSVENANRE